MLEISKSLPTKDTLPKSFENALNCLEQVITDLKLLQIDRIYNSKPNQEIIIKHIENIQNLKSHLESANTALIRDLIDFEII